MKISPRRISSGLIVSAILLICASARSQTGGNYQIFVSNEKAGTVTVIDGADFKVSGTIPVGKRSKGSPSPRAGTIQFVLLQPSYFQWFACTKSNCYAVGIRHQTVPAIYAMESTFDANPERPSRSLPSIQLNRSGRGRGPG